MYSSTTPLEQQSVANNFPKLKTKSVFHTSIILIVSGVLAVVLQVSYKAAANIATNSIFNWISFNDIVF